MTPTILTASAVVDRLTVDGIVTAADAQARTLTGRAVLWGEVGHTSAGPARFARGSLDVADPSRVKLLVEHDPNRVVGYATTITPDDAGVTATFRVAEGAAGDEVLASAAGRLRDGLSVGVQIDAAAVGADGVLDVSSGRWRETSVVALPAMPSSLITHVAASTPPAVPGMPPAVPNVPVVPRVPAMVQGRAEVDLNAQWAAMAAAFKAGGGEGLLRAALSDVVLPPTQAERDLWAQPQWVGALWQARAGVRRPLIDAFTHKPLTSIRVSGFQKVYPIAGVGEYAGGKAAVPSTGTWQLVPVTADAKRIAGAHDVDRILIDLGGFGDESFVSSYFEAQTDNYKALTESLVATQILAEATPMDAVDNADGTAVDVVATLVAVASYLGGIGANLDFIKVAPDVYGSLFGILQSNSPWLLDGSASLANGTAGIGGLNITSDPLLAAGTFLAGDKRAATFFEWSPAPIRVQAVNIPNGGVDLGVFGYWALIVNEPAAVVSVDMSAPVVGP